MAAMFLSQSPSPSSFFNVFPLPLNTPGISVPSSLTSLRTSPSHTQKNVTTLTTAASKPFQRFSQQKNRNFTLKSAAGESYAVETPSSSSSPPTLELKLKLLRVVSGLNRGLAANEEDLIRADNAAKELEEAGGPVDLSKDLDKLQGRWKLIYSSAFSSRTLGGSRPGPPTGRLLPVALEQVFQRIDVVSKDFDNIVDLQLGTPWPFPPIELTATLAHKFELVGTAKIKIVTEKTTVKAKGNLAQFPPLEVPRIPNILRTPFNAGAGEFEVTYLDNDTRITRGDRGELRVFLVA